MRDPQQVGLPEDEPDSRMSAPHPVEAKVLRRNPDGSGVVEIPILSETDRLDLARTSTRQGPTISITAQDLRDIVRNFSEWTGPVPIHRDPHRDYSETGGPADGFIEALSVRDSLLVAHVFLTAPVMQEFMAGAWRGFSVDMAKDLKRATREHRGRSVYGGVLTNRPATDINYRIQAAERIAASAAMTESNVHITPFVVYAAKPQEGLTMPENDATVQLAAAQQDAKNKSDEIVSLKAQLEGVGGEMRTLKEKLIQAEVSLSAALADVDAHKATATRRDAEAKSSEQMAAGFEAQLRAERTAHEKLKDQVLGEQVSKLCRDGVRRGMPPAFFGKDGIKTVEADPVAWFKGRFASLAALEENINALPKTAFLSATQSNAPDADEDAVMPKEIYDALVRRGLDPRYASLSTLDDLNRLKQTKK